MLQIVTAGNGTSPTKVSEALNVITTGLVRYFIITEYISHNDVAADKTNKTAHKIL